MSRFRDRRIGKSVGGRYVCPVLFLCDQQVLEDIDVEREERSLFFIFL